MESKEALQQMARTLEASGEYRVLTRLSTEAHTPIRYAEPSGGQVFTGCVLDTETTGLDHNKDKVIEIGMVVFEYDAGGILRVVDRIDELQDPGFPLDPKTTHLTGITDADLAGRSFDAGRINHAAERCALVIAHNAGFDRRMVEPIFPVFATRPWACSQTQIPWAEWNISSAKLEYLAFTNGFFYDAHRAETDCLALLHLLARPSPLPGAGESVFAVLRRNARKNGAHLWLAGLPFDQKDQAKAEGYL